MADVPRLAAELNQPAYVLLESFHDGPLPPERSFADDGRGSAVVTVVKQAENSDDVVVRGYETAGREAEASIELPLLGRSLRVVFGANEIKTVFVPRNPAQPVRETNLLEQ